MIDLLIIAAYLFVIIRVLLKVFNWIQNKFNIYGTPQESSQTIQQVHTQSSSQPSKIKQNQPVSKLQKEKVEESKKIQPKEAKKEPLKQKQPIKSNTETIKKQQDKKIQQEKVKESSQVPKKVQVPVHQKQQTQKKQYVSLNNSIPQKVQKQNSSANLQLVESLRKQIQQLKLENSNLVKKLQSQIEESQIHSQDQWKLNDEIQHLKKNHESAILQIKNSHNEEIEKIKKQLQAKQNQVNIQSQATQNQVNLGQSSDPSKVVALESRIQQMKNQLQFCQSQLQNAYQSESKLKEQVQQLQNTLNNTKVKAKSLISISDVVSHPQYMRVKQKLQKYQSGITSITSSRPRSIVRAQFTPQGEKIYKAADSRISQRRSFISRIADGPQKTQNSQEVFGECTFLNQQNKSFLLDEIRRIKKLAIKKTKLIFRLDKLHPSNPHQFIDNIPNIVILIELTNGKLLGGFTQVAFSKQDSHQKGSVARSKFGANKSLILDLSNKMAFPNTSPNDTIVYDQNAIVFGKDELVIKNDEPTLLYSSFGQQGGVYWDGKYTLQELLGSGNGFERINHYEFHRIYIS